MFNDLKLSTNHTLILLLILYKKYNKLYNKNFWK